MRRLRALCLVLMTILCSISLWGQTTATITGTVTDPSGAVIPNAKIELRDLSTNTTLKAATNDVGQYTFPSVPPGNYKITASAKGFNQMVMQPVAISVGKTPALNFRLRVGAEATTVEVQAGTATELQTLDASVGNVIDRKALADMPSLNRDATALLLLQPMATPGFNQAPGTGVDNTAGGTVAGSRADQNTFLIDGGDATSNTEGAGGYNTSFVATPRAVVPTPVESLEEFRVTTNNPSATFSQSAGGAVQMVTRRGTNAWHGAGYGYLQNDNLNANTWVRNNSGQPNPEMKDLRYGARVGGPIIKDKTFFFVHWEGRRFLRTEDFTRLVPSTLLRQGILQFRDASGVLRQYNLNSAAAVCGDPAQGVALQACDPRGFGLNPVVSALWATLPASNRPGAGSGGDGLNTLRFTAPVPFIVHEDFAVARVDHKISDKWNFMSSFRYGVTDAASTAQVDIGGITPGATRGVPKATNNRPLQPRYLVAGLTGTITPNLTNDFRFDWLRHWWQWSPASPFPQVSGTAAALATGGIPRSAESRTTAMVPVNVDTQNARQRVWNGRDLTFVDNLTWLKGKHLIQIGGRWTRQDFLHVRDDKVVGGVSNPVYQIGSGTDISLGTANRPPACSATVTTNCLASANLSSWDFTYIDVLGIVSRATQVFTRQADFTPNPALTPTRQNTLVNSYQAYFSDTWRLTPSLTFTYGLTWNAQLPPYEKTGKDAMMVIADTRQIVDIDSYLAAKAVAASNGTTYNPTLGLVPVQSLGRRYPYDPQWGQVGPRLALAWNPSFTAGPFASIFGDRKSVIRAGYGRVFDRTNGVGIVMTPALASGFNIARSCRRPRTNGTCGSTASSPSNGFRIGRDGTTVTVPPLQSITGGMLIPGVNAPSELLDFRIDPKRKIGVEEMWDLNIQRELPWNMLFEIGYVGRVGYRLPYGKSLTQVPYMFKRGGQTFASAYDAIASALRAGKTPAAQPFFETLYGAGGTNSVVLSPTGLDLGSSFQGGTVWDIFTTIECDIDTVNCVVPDGQFFSSTWTTSSGRSTYHAGFMTLRKRTSSGLTFQANYTLAHSLDHYGLTQENVLEPTDSYNIGRDWGPSLFDRRHTLNAFFSYELPFSRGRRYAPSSSALEKVVGGWTISGIFNAASGIPFDVVDFGSCQEFGGGSGIFTNCAALISSNKGAFSASRHDTVTGGGSEPNSFANPNAVLATFRRLLFSDLRAGRGAVHGMSRWNMDFGIAKTVKITERVSSRFDAQFINLFNHPLLDDSGAAFGSTDLDLATPGSFGSIGSKQFNAPRFVQLGLRIDF